MSYSRRIGNVVVTLIGVAELAAIVLVLAAAVVLAWRAAL